MTRYGMAIDLDSCIGCFACAVSCKDANNLPNGFWWNRILTIGGDGMDTASGTYPGNLKMYHLPKGCQHCANPGCVSVCPTGASYQREDGIVMVDSEMCIGCRSCISACPYDVRVHYVDPTEYYLDFPVGDPDAPAHIDGRVDKCMFCYQRIDRGEMPACMEQCQARARFWGDLDDPESDVSKFLAERQPQALLEDQGTGPSVFYVSSRHSLAEDVTSKAF